MFILILLVPLLMGCRFVKEDNEIFGIETTKALKGLFAAGVVLHHLCAYFCPPIASMGFYRNLGFIMVSGFFMISGYGLTYSATKKEGYLKHFIKNRMFPIVTAYYLAAFGYLLMYRHYHVLDWERIRIIMTGQNYWFIYAILVMYVGFGMAFSAVKKKYAPYVCTAWVFAYMLFMYVKSFQSPGLYGFWWFNSCLAFLAGMWFCLLRNRILAFLGKMYVLKLVLCTLIFAAAFFGVYAIEDKSSNLILLCELISSVTFSVLIIQFTMKFKVNNFVLRNLGTVSLELYLIQALWIYVIGNEYTSYIGAVGMVVNIIIRTVITAYIIHYENKAVMWGINKVLPKGNNAE